jgi:predicted hotdog family 3-hydroxylacyl-ACP dehydratase
LVGIVFEINFNRTRRSRTFFSLSFTEGLNMSDVSITQFVPHRPPALLVQDIVEYFEDGLVAQVAWPEGEGVPLLLIEAAAQSVAAYKGHAHALEGAPVTEGFLVGVRDFSLPPVLPSGGTWTVRVVQNKDLRPFFLFDAEVFHNRVLQASGTLTLFEREKQAHAPTL